MVTTKKTAKPRGRPAANKPTPSVAQAVVTSPETTVNVAVQEPIRNEGQRELEKTPRKRIPFGTPRTKLEVPYMPEGYHGHWVNDDAGRIFAAQQGYYEFVTPDEVGLDKTEDNKVKVLVGKNAQNGPLFAYLMKIKLEYYKEDRQLINSKQDEFERALKQLGNNQNGEYGYVPKEGIKIS